MPNNSVFIERKAQKQLLKLPQELQARVSNAIDILQDEGFSSSLDIKRLKGWATDIESEWETFEYFLSFPKITS